MTIRPEGQFARFAFHRKEISNEPKARTPLFKPSSSDKLSVSDVCDLDCTGIVDEGIKVGNRRKDAKSLSLYGWAEFDQEIIRRANLQLDYDNVPERHANIVGWLTDADARRDQQITLVVKACATKLGSPVPIKKQDASG